MKASEARSITNNAVSLVPKHTLEQVYNYIESGATAGTSFIQNINLSKDDYNKLCEDGYVIKMMDKGNLYSISW